MSASTGTQDFQQGFLLLPARQDQRCPPPFCGDGDDCHCVIGLFPANDRLHQSASGIVLRGNLLAAPAGSKRNWITVVRHLPTKVSRLTPENEHRRRTGVSISVTLVSGAKADDLPLPRSRQRSQEPRHVGSTIQRSIVWTLRHVRHIDGVYCRAKVQQ